MWSISFQYDPIGFAEPSEKSLWNSLDKIDSVLLNASISIEKILQLKGASAHDLEIFESGKKVAKVTLAHLVSQEIESFVPYHASAEDDSFVATIETLQMLRMTLKQKKRPRHDGSLLKRRHILSPYVFERTDIYCDDNELHLSLVIVLDSTVCKDTSNVGTYDCIHSSVLNALSEIVEKVPCIQDIMSQVANTILQEKIRQQLPSLDAVAFLANGSIIPRKSGASFAPMASPSAIPFLAPEDSSMTRDISINMGQFYQYIKNPNVKLGKNDSSVVKLRGLVVPKGITLIVGGGYHGKSTMLRAIMTGVYNKHLGDGRELCVTDSSAVSVRAEDGRYVPKPTNISAFISNLPFGKHDSTRHFSTREASGSTSQAANVAEAIEMKSRAILVDEDLAAANFMSRDGRMRALVMDESITPLLYRVNGLFQKHGISSVVVVGGVGDWLDVPNAVIMLNKYVVSDALQKAKSISSQFSHGHVQYGGRGVVHRLPWDSDGNPYRRRPNDIETLFGNLHGCMLSLIDGGGKLVISRHESCSEKDGVSNYFITEKEGEFYEKGDEDDRIIDMTRCEQLMGGNPQLFGCGLCVLWILNFSSQHPELDLNELLDALEDMFDKQAGFQSIIENWKSNESIASLSYQSLLKFTGHAYRPRRFEIAQALTRIRGLTFHELPTEVDEEDIRIKKEAEERKRALAELWANRKTRR